MYTPDRMQLPTALVDFHLLHPNGTRLAQRLQVNEHEETVDFSGPRVPHPTMLCVAVSSGRQGTVSLHALGCDTAVALTRIISEWMLGSICLVLGSVFIIPSVCACAHVQSAAAAATASVLWCMSYNFASRICKCRCMIGWCGRGYAMLLPQERQQLFPANAAGCQLGCS